MSITTTSTVASIDSEPALLTRLRGSDEEALAGIMRLHGAMVERAAATSGLDPSEIPDVIQATFLVLWNSRKNPPSAGKLGSWLYGVTRNLARRHMRTRTRSRSRESSWQQHQPAMTTDPESSNDPLVAASHSRILHHAMEKLGMPQRQLIIARFWQGKRFSAIAGELGCSEDAAKKRCNSALGKLRALMIAAGLTSISSAQVASLLETEAALPATHAVLTAKSLHAASAPARALARTWQAGPSPAFQGGIAASAFALAAVGILLHSQWKEEASTDGKKAAADTARLDSPTRDAGPPPPSRATTGAIPLSKWKWGMPTALLKALSDPRRKSPFSHFPMGITWLDGKPLVPVVSGFKTDKAVFRLFTTDGKAWKELLTIDGLHFPKLTTLRDGSIGIVGHTGENPSAGYGSSLYYYRVDPVTGVSEPYILAEPGTAYDRVTLVGLNEVTDNDLVAVLMLEASGAGRQLYETRSTDGGKTWSDITAKRPTTMSEDAASTMGVLPLGKEGLGIFNFSSNGALEMLVAPPGGGDWQSRPVSFSDDMPADARRMPLSAVNSGSEIALAYLVEIPNADKPRQASGAYYLTTSQDGGTTWDDGRLLAPVARISDASSMLELTASQGSIVANYLDTSTPAPGAPFQNRLLATEDSGRSWSDLTPGTGGVLLGASSFSPSGGSILTSGTVPGADRSETFQVRELRVDP